MAKKRRNKKARSGDKPVSPPAGQDTKADALLKRLMAVQIVSGVLFVVLAALLIRNYGAAQSRWDNLDPIVKGCILAWLVGVLSYRLYHSRFKNRLLGDLKKSPQALTHFAIQQTLSTILSLLGGGTVVLYLSGILDPWVPAVSAMAGSVHPELIKWLMAGAGVLISGAAGSAFYDFLKWFVRAAK